jgi:hypothetical protein
MLVAVAVKLSTPPEGVITVLVGEDGTAEAGPRVLEVLGASHTGLTSAVVGAATLPAIWGVTTDWAWLVPISPTRTAGMAMRVTATTTRTVLFRSGVPSWERVGRGDTEFPFCVACRSGGCPPG